MDTTIKKRLQTTRDDEDEENDKGGQQGRTRKQQSKRGWKQIQGRMRKRTRDNGDGGRRVRTRTQQSKRKTRTCATGHGRSTDKQQQRQSTNATNNAYKINRSLELPPSVHPT